MANKVLWISASVPYDTVGHAGGKIHNFYLKYLKEHSENEIKLVTFYWEKEKDKIDLDAYGIDYHLLKRGIWTLPRLLCNAESVLNPYNRYAGINQNYTILQLSHMLKKIRRSGYKPDVIILQWTEMLVLIEIVKREFPNIPVIGIEEDVKFLNYERAYNMEEKKSLKRRLGIKYRKLKQIELEACRNSQKIILNNYKDRDLLAENGIGEEKLCVWQPYFENYSQNPYIGNEKVILFYGAMARGENWRSAVWFIENVFYKLEDQEVKFYIAGSNPNPKLFEYQNDRVKVLGFVEDIGEYFSSCQCLVAPLLLGAGVKIKVLEAMSAGIPVVTNNIGIEGIPARNMIEYVHCEKVDEYVSSIDELIKNASMRKKISGASKAFINNRFNLIKSAEEFAKLIEKVR